MTSQNADFENKTFILGLGAQKSGTTWLYDYLNRRPDVYMHPIKEVHFFDGLYEAEKWPNVVKNRLAKEQKLASSLEQPGAGANAERLQKYQNIKERNRYYSEPDLYIEHFRRCSGDCRAFGEITAEYTTLSAATYKRMYDIHPDVRFVLLVRDPVDRLWSQIKMLSKFERRGFEPGRSQRQRVDRALANEKIIERSQYDLTLRNLLSLVPRRSVHIGFYEELFSDRSIRSLCEFLSLPFMPGEYGKLVNESRGQQLEDRQARRIYQHLAATYEYFEAEFGDRLPASWQVYQQ